MLAAYLFSDGYIFIGGTKDVTDGNFVGLVPCLGAHADCCYCSVWIRRHSSALG